tara:strand:- start:1450 stop:2277 length:828 start_codon:yes stop_codon:yes gene_type:complete
MAKELPYFKFETSEWDNGTIQMCSRESKGLFIDLCSMYWARLGDVKSKLAVQKLCNGNANALQELIEEEIIYVIEDKIIIHFLDNQLKEFNAVSDKRKKAANKRWEQSTDKQDVNASALQVQSKSNAIREEKIKEDNKIKDCLVPPIGENALYFYIAKAYHNTFYNYKGSKSLEKAIVSDWTKVIRLLIENDNVKVTHLIAIKMFLQAGIDKEKGVDTFWSDTIYSISALRKKSKDGVYQIDRIIQATKKWLDRNPEKEAMVYQAETKLNELTNG